MKAALFWFLIVVAAALAAPPLLGEASQALDLAHSLQAPSASHWMGTDALGRDLFYRLLCGTRVSVGVGLAAVLISMLVGILIGSAAGYFGGWTDRLLMGLTDAMLCFPTFFLILAVIAILGPGIWPIVIIIGVTGWMGTARLVRAEVLSLKDREFVLAARAFGAGPARILGRHLIPNALGPAIVHAILGVSSAILIETGLSFLGVGVQPPAASWGNILMDGKAVLDVAWWMTLFPGLAIFFTTLSANVLGEYAAEKIRGER